jgi:hypothetical protein
MAMSSPSRGLFGRPKPTEEERQKALEDPGEPWGQWFYFTFLKVWIPLGFLILDGWIAGAALEVRNYPALVIGLVAAVYLEFLAFRALWAHPPDDESPSRPFRRSWYRPVRFGRWTAESWYPERFRSPTPGRTGPDPNEFL